jgi:predicted transcriptional regulator
MPKRLEDPAAGLHPVHARVAMLSLAGMSQAAIALFLGSSSEAVGHILRLPKVVQYTTALRATMVTDVRRLARELNEKLEENAVEALEAQIEIMKAAKDECLDPSDADRRWEAGRLAVASAQDILSRTIPKPQIGSTVEHNHRHLHAVVPTGLLEAVKALNGNGHNVAPSDIIDVSEPTPEGSLPDDVEDEDGDGEQPNP